MGGGVVYSG